MLSPASASVPGSLAVCGMMCGSAPGLPPVVVLVLSLLRVECVPPEGGSLVSDDGFGLVLGVSVSTALDGGSGWLRRSVLGVMVSTWLDLSYCGLIGVVGGIWGGVGLRPWLLVLLPILRRPLVGWLDGGALRCVASVCRMVVTVSVEGVLRLSPPPLILAVSLSVCSGSVSLSSHGAHAMSWE